MASRVLLSSKNRPYALARTGNLHAFVQPRWEISLCFVQTWPGCNWSIIFSSKIVTMYSQDDTFNICGDTKGGFRESLNKKCCCSLIPVNQEHALLIINFDLSCWADKILAGFIITGFVAVWIWVRTTLPRYRYDLLMNLTWKFYLPGFYNHLMMPYFIPKFILARFFRSYILRMWFWANIVAFVSLMKNYSRIYPRCHAKWLDQLVKSQGQTPLDVLSFYGNPRCWSG